MQHGEKVPPVEELPIMKPKDFILQQAKDLERRVSRQGEKAPEGELRSMKDITSAMSVMQGQVRLALMAHS